ncbi:MAG: glutaminyl-peptide cyclotransferase [Sphingobacteriia bacterium]|nr:MAG: glutaminyl-peptide cyclotransferase [Sphingobacteriia bacterium]
MRKIYTLLFLILCLASCEPQSSKEPEIDTNIVPSPAVINYSIIKLYPHDTSSYTQGLIWHNNQLYESTGMEKESKLLEVALNSGKALRKLAIPDNEFGEGITILNNKIYQLTWTNHLVHVYDLKTFKKLQEFEWPYEGWGITNNGSNLIISTGGSNLYLVNPTTFKIEKTIGVSDNNGYISSLNELEYIEGFIYSNQYMTDYILKIDPLSGSVVGKIDFKNLLKEAGSIYDPRSIDAGYVLNGIAYNPTTKHIYITGKRWPILFEIQLGQ